MENTFLKNQRCNIGCAPLFLVKPCVLRRGSGFPGHRIRGNSPVDVRELRQTHPNTENVCKSFSGTSEASIDSVSSLTHLSEYASIVLWAGVFWLGYRLFSQMNESEPHGRECETCGGSGYVECFCTRWSDGDRRGCSSCGGSLQTVCHSCGGGGTAVPILGKVYIKDEKDYRM